jgi:hypothetical protein
MDEDEFFWGMDEDEFFWGMDEDEFINFFHSTLASKLQAWYNDNHEGR